MSLQGRVFSLFEVSAQCDMDNVSFVCCGGVWVRWRRSVGLSICKQYREHLSVFFLGVLGEGGLFS